MSEVLVKDSGRVNFKLKAAGNLEAWLEKGKIDTRDALS